MLSAFSVLSEQPPGISSKVPPITTEDNGPSTTVDAAALSPILKYEDPVLARPRAGFDMGMGHDSLPQYVSLYSSNEQKEAGGVVLRSKSRQYTRDDRTAILKAIIPNREWLDEAGEWVQTVSSAEWTRAELESLQSKVDARLATLQARPGALCAVREQICSELYDEVIREITLECPERGLLLLRLRDEARMTLESYAEIYRDSVIFSRRKADGAREKLDGVRLLHAELKEQTGGLQAKVRSLEAGLAVINRRNAYAKATMDQEHSEALQVTKEEQKALETTITKSQKKLKEAAAAAASTA